MELKGYAVGDSHSVDITSIVDALDDSGSIFIVIHNHPSNRPFSPRDIQTFIAAQNMAILMVIGNLGAMYILEKTRYIYGDSIRKALKEIVINYRSGKSDFETTINKLSEYGVVYKSV